MGQTTDLLVIVLIVLIVAVVLDGLRRKWRGRGDRVVMKLDKSFLRGDGDDAADELLPNSELPNGGARTVIRGGEAPAPVNPPTSGSRRKPGTPAVGDEKSGHEAVPVLMDTVELEETTIEHANVFVPAQAPQQFAPELFEDEAASGEVRSNAVEGNEMLDVQVEELDRLGGSGVAPSAGRNPAYDDEDEEDNFDEDDDDFDEDEDDDWDDDEDDYEDEDEDEDDYPDRRHDEDEDDEDDDDWDDDWDDEDDEDEPHEDDDEDDDWDDDDEDDEDEERYSGDYESEPTLLEETYARAASRFSRPEPAPEVRIEPGFGDAGNLDPVEDDALLEEDFSVSFQDEPLFTEPLAADAAPVPEETAARAETTPEPESAERGRGRQQRGRDKAERVPFFSKSLLGRQQQKELFAEEAGHGAVEEAATDTTTAGAEGPSEVLVINVMARQGHHFFGEELLPVLRRQGMQLGEMSIFHRHESTDGSGRVVFSMANMVKPGTFDLATMDQFATPGLSLFLQLPNKYGNMQAFDLMLATATALREGLDGELKDENRSVFTRQTIEHSRQRIRDFELSLLSRK